MLRKNLSAQMENKITTFWIFLNSKKMAKLTVIILLIYIVITYIKQLNLKNNCEKIYDKCVITNIENTILGSTYITYEYKINEELNQHKFKTSTNREILKKIKVGDTLKLEYCKEDFKTTNEPILNGEYLNNSLP